jgi:hypothetical protein
MKEAFNKLINYVKGLDETAPLDEIVQGEVPPIHKGFSTSTKEKHYKELDVKWELTSNTVVGEEIWSRTFTELIFETDDNEDPVYVKEVTFDEYDPELKGTEFYRVNHPFYEDIYKGTKPFFRWNRERMIWYQEMFFHNRKENTVRWDRPFSTYNNPDSSTHDLYDELPPVFTKTLSCGRALGVVIRSDVPFDLQVGESLYTNITESPKISPLGEPQVTLTFKNIRNQSFSQYQTSRYEEDIELIETWYQVSPPGDDVSPKYIEIDIYGTAEAKAGRSYHPQGEDEEYREILVHPQTTPYEARLKPPGKAHQFKDDFWNTEDMTRTSKKYKKYNQRRFKDPAWQ